MFEMVDHLLITTLWLTASVNALLLLIKRSAGHLIRCVTALLAKCPCIRERLKRCNLNVHRARRFPLCIIAGFEAVRHEMLQKTLAGWSGVSRRGSSSSVHLAYTYALPLVGGRDRRNETGLNGSGLISAVVGYGARPVVEYIQSLSWNAIDSVGRYNWTIARRSIIDDFNSFVWYIGSRKLRWRFLWEGGIKSGWKEGMFYDWKWTDNKGFATSAAHVAYT